jgi:putative hydrolase of the HAD superfamily
MTSGIRLLTFDLDDTLWEFGPLLERAELHTYAWLQRRVPALTERFSPTQLAELRITLARSRPEHAHRISQLRRDTLRQALLDSGTPADEAEALAAEAFAVFLDARSAVAPFAAAETVLERLRRDYTLGAITNGNCRLAPSGLDRYFSFVVYGEELAQAKPHPEPFLLALSMANCEASACIHIGDDVEHDIRAAQQLDIDTIWMNFRGTVWPGGTPPSAEIRQLDELPDAVARVVVKRDARA